LTIKSSAPGPDCEISSSKELSTIAKEKYAIDPWGLRRKDAELNRVESLRN
jgi:hypothetical protein